MNLLEINFDELELLVAEKKSKFFYALMKTGVKLLKK